MLFGLETVLGVCVLVRPVVGVHEYARNGAVEWQNESLTVVRVLNAPAAWAEVQAPARVVAVDPYKVSGEVE